MLQQQVLQLECRKLPPPPLKNVGSSMLASIRVLWTLILDSPLQRQHERLPSDCLPDNTAGRSCSTSSPSVADVQNVTVIRAAQGPWRSLKLTRGTSCGQTDGEAGCLPELHRAIVHWMQPTRKLRASSGCGPKITAPAQPAHRRAEALRSS